MQVDSATVERANDEGSVSSEASVRIGKDQRSRFPVWKAARRKFPPNHSFFNAGNVERELLAKQVSLNITDEEKAYIGKIEEEEFWIINCPIVGCGAKLKGLEELESHYLARHTAMCSVCSHIFPTKRLLSIHISETHDSFFQAKVARNYPMYECLVEGCSCVFHSDAARHQHLVDKHKFPRAFQFHKKKHPSQRQRQHVRSKHYVGGPAVSTGKKTPSNVNVEKKPAEVTSQAATEKEAGGDKLTEMDVEVDQLSSGVSRLSTADSNVPPAISFGRKHNRGLGLVPVQQQSKPKSKVSTKE